MITQQQLKILCQWWLNNVKYKIEISPNKREIGFTINNITLRFHPHIDSNQLDALEDKFIKEVGIGAIDIYFYDDEVEIIYRGDINYSDCKKTKNEARLSTILNYVDRKDK